MILIHSWLISFLFSLASWVQPTPKPVLPVAFAKPISELSQADDLYGAAKSLIKREMYNEAVPYFAKAAHAYDAKKLYEQSARSYLYIAEIHQYFGNNPLALKYLDSAESTSSYLFKDKAKIVAECLRTKGRIARNLGKALDAKNYMEQSLATALTVMGVYDTSLTFTYNTLGQIYDQLFNYKEALNYYKKALACKVLSKSKIDYELADYYYNVGNQYSILGLLPQSLENLNVAINLTKIIDARIPGPALDYFLAKAIVFQSLGKYDASYAVFEEAEKIGLSIIDKDLTIEGMIFIAKGSLYFKTGDFARGKENVEYANYLINKDPYTSNFKKYWINYYLSDLFYRSGDYKTSLSYAYKCLKNQKDYMISDQTKANKLIADNLYKLGNIKKADKYYAICVEEVKKERTQRVSYIDKIYTNYGHFLFKTGKKQLGIKYAKEGLALNQASFGLQHPVTADNLNALGELYSLNGQQDKALDCFQQSLIASSSQFNDAAYAANPLVENITFKPEAFATLKNKAASLSKFYASSNNVNQLIYSFNTYQLSLDLIHKNRASFPELESKIWVSGAEKETFDGAINTAYTLFLKTGSDYYKQKVFEFSEQSKAAALFASLREKKALETGGIPDSLIKKEEFYIEKIERLQNKMLAEQQLDQPNSRKIKDLQADIFVMKNDQSKLLATLEKNFTSYHRLKYDKSIVSIENLRQKLNDNQVMLEYAFTGKQILLFAISPERYDIYKIEKPADFDAMLGNMRAYLDELSFISQTTDVYSNFLKSSNDLYNVLVKPAEKMIKDRNLIIVPDEALATIPFEVLLTARVNEQKEYGFLPYLITRNAIGYAYSGNLLYYQPSSAPTESVSMAAFSPSYADLEEEKPNSANFRYRSFLKPLPFAREEANSVSRIFGGDIYINKNASESNFKKVAPRYDVLHLSMHAIVDNENPMHSNLAFGNDGSGTEDGYLNTFELLNMKLKARMAVLSACNTGVGALQKGEGVMSLARGFYYAGCPDVVMTMWPVEDQLSSSLIQDFYHYLAQGKNKAEALQLAKINFLKSADPLRAHPYFWAGYVNIGDTSPLVEKQKERPGGTIAWASFLGMLLTLLPFAWKLF